MLKQNKAYKFRLYPTEEQAHLIRKTFGCVRFVYNKMLAERKEIYETYKENKEELKKQNSLLLRNTKWRMNGLKRSIP